MANTGAGATGAVSKEKQSPSREKPLMSHHRSTVTAAGALLCLALAGSAAAAIPEPVAGPAPTDQERPCFMVRAHWNNALDGPQPTC